MNDLHATIRTVLGEDAGQFDPRHLEAVLLKRQVDLRGLSQEALRDEIEFSRVAVVLLGADRAEEMAQACKI